MRTNKNNGRKCLAVEDKIARRKKIIAKGQHKIENMQTIYGKGNIDLYLLLNTNRELRRFCSISIIAYLIEKGELNGKSNFVTFVHNKFTVTSDDISRDFKYSEEFFIKALVSAFSLFAEYAEKTMDKFCISTMGKEITDVTNREECDEYVNRAIGYMNCKKENDIEITETVEENNKG